MRRVTILPGVALVLRADLPQGFAIHETATNSVTWPARVASEHGR